MTTKLPDEEMQRLVEECDYDTRLAVTAWVMKAICDHAKRSGSYRYLIYERLGFDFDAYSALYPDGMDISNYFEFPTCYDIEFEYEPAKKIDLDRMPEFLAPHPWA